MNAGLHLPNRRLYADDLARMVACKAVDYVVYLYDMADVDYWANVVEQLRALVPGCRVHLRIEQRGTFDAAADAAILATVGAKIRADSYRIRNEPNVEGVGSSAADWGRYLVDLAGRIPDGVRGKLAVPAISPGTADWLNWVRASHEAMVTAPTAYSAMDVHLYGSPGEVEGQIGQVRSIDYGVIRCTEHNFGAGRTYGLGIFCDDIPRVLDVCRRYDVEMCCLFIWEWAHPDISLPTTVNVRGTDVETWLVQNQEDIVANLETLQAQVNQVLEQNRILNEQWKRFRQGKWTGADGIDGGIVAMQGGKPLDFEPSYPPKA